MNKRQYTTLTSQGKDQLFRGQNTATKPVEPSLSQKQNKFLQHFNTINNVDPLIHMYARSGSSDENNEALYMSKLQSYAESKISQIDRIIRSNDDENNIKPLKGDFKISPAIPLIHAKPQIKRNIMRINDFFNTEEPKLSSDERKQQEELFQTEILQIAAYSQILRSLPSKPKQEPKPQPAGFYSSIYNTPTQRPFHQYNSFTSPPFNQTQTQRHQAYTTPDKFPPYPSNQQIQSNQAPNTVFTPEVKFRKADMLLVEILREKKRKGLVPDYYKIMELKLFQLLDFILQDEEEYNGLSSIEKMKQVLKKLESFKGKKVEGENKINLLKIFFEEFRNLKNEISQNEKKKPLQKVQNKPKHVIQKQIPPKQTKEAFIEKKGTQNQNNFKKTPFKETMSMVGDKRQKPPNPQANKSVKGMQDQWLGQQLQ